MYITELNWFGLSIKPGRIEEVTQKRSDTGLDTNRARAAERG